MLTQRQLPDDVLKKKQERKNWTDTCVATCYKEKTDSTGVAHAEATKQKATTSNSEGKGIRMQNILSKMSRFQQKRIIRYAKKGKKIGKHDPYTEAGIVSIKIISLVSLDF